MFCKKCGTEIDHDARFCCCCGTFVERAPQQTTSATDNFSAPGQVPAGGYGVPIATPAPAQQPTYYGVKKEYSYVPPHAAKPAPKASTAKQTDTDAACAPLSMWSYLLHLVLFTIPVVNLVLAFIWSFSDKVNPNKRNLSRAMLIIFGACIVLCILYLCIMLLLASGGKAVYYFRF